MHESDLVHENSVLQEKLEKIYSLRRTGSKINWDAAHYRALLTALGDPHLSLPPVIHVAGTNGKGSVIAILDAILRAQGLRVHCYTSPHLVHVNERIVLAGQEISDETLECLIDEVLLLSHHTPLSFFEIITAVAFKAFSENPADILLLEVGMGGRLDCTNVIENPIATVINRISKDHTEFLGDTIDKITAEKAGIIKHAVPCVVGDQGENSLCVFSVIESAAKKEKSNTYVHGRDWSIMRKEQSMIFQFESEETQYPLPALVGQHQVQNAGVALATLQCVKEKVHIDTDAIHTGLRAARWPGRMQQLDSHRFGLSPDDEIWLDSGHNDSAGEAIAAQMRAWATENMRKPIYMVIGMLGMKDVLSFMQPMVTHCAGIYCIPIPNESDCHDATTIRRALSVADLNYAIIQCDHVISAINNVPKCSDGVRIVIAGSAYLAGDILQSYDSM